MWNFHAATSTLDWYAGGYCQDLSVLTGTGSERALTARIAGAEARGDIAYHFSGVTDLSFAPYMRLDLGVLGAEQARYEVQLRLVGSTDTVSASAIVTGGERQSLYLDLSPYTQQISSVRSIRLLVRPLDGTEGEYRLCLYGVHLESDKLTQTELSQRISAIRQQTENDVDDKETKKDYTMPLVVTGIVILASAAITALLLIRHKSKRPSQKGRAESK